MSLFEVSRTSDGIVTVNFHITTTTIILIALYWLPPMLKVIAVTGGKIKTSLVEVELPGAVSWLEETDTETQRVLLSSFIAGIETIENPSPDVREHLSNYENRLAELPPPVQDANNQLKTNARLYNEIRNLPRGSERTIKMGTIVNQIKSLVHLVDFKEIGFDKLVDSESQGDRIVGLALLQVKPDKLGFPLVKNAIGCSKSGFEQYQALRAAEQMLSILDNNEKQELVKVINEQRSEGDKKYIKPGTDRWGLSIRILNAIYRM